MSATSRLRVKLRWFDKPKGKLRKTGNAEMDARYRTYVNWDFMWGCGFLRVPIGEWRWKPYFGWEDQVVGFSWLFFMFKWSKSFSYVERLDWKIQTEMNRITNMMIDNINMSIWP